MRRKIEFRLILLYTQSKQDKES